MPTIVTKTVGAGRDYATLTLFNAWAATLDLIALDQKINVLLYEDQHLNFGMQHPLTCDGSHYITIQPAPGLGVNDLNTSGACTYGTAGIEITDSWMPNIPQGVFAIGLRFDGTPRGVNFAGSGWEAGGLYGGALRCRILSSQPVTLGNYGSLAVLQDCLIIRTTSGGPVVDAYASSSVMQRNTLVNASGTTQTADGMGVINIDARYICEDNLLVNCGTRPLTGSIGVSGTINSPILTNLPPDLLGTLDVWVTVFNANLSDTALSSNNTTNELAGLSYASPLVVNVATDFRPTGAAIGAGNAAAVSRNDLRGNNRGVTPDVGAVQFTPAMPLPIATIGVALSGQTLVLSGATTHTPTFGAASLTPAGGGAVAQGPSVVTLATNTFTVTFTNVLPGSYAPVVSLANAGGTLPTTGANFRVLGLAGNPVAGQAPVSSGGTPVPTILTVSLYGRTLSANGMVDLQGDTAGTLTAFLDPQPSGASVPITTSSRYGAATPNVVGNFWGLQTVLSGNSYVLRIVASANGRQASVSSAPFSVSVAAGTLTLPDVVNAPTLTFQSVSSRVPGSTSTAVYRFSYGAPASVTATVDGAGLTVSGVTVSTTSGTGATAAGTVTFTFTMPAAGSHTLAVTSTGTYATTAPDKPLIAAAPVLTWLSFTNTFPTSPTASAKYAFANGAPTDITATLDGTSLSVRNVLITTTAGAGHEASGTVVFQYTNPAAGTHTLVVNGTGTYASTGASKTLIAANADLTFVSWSSTTAGSTNTATFSFATGAPTGINASIFGTALPVSGFSTIITSGSGASAAGSASFAFTNPTPGAYTVVLTGTGPYASPTFTTVLLSTT